MSGYIPELTPIGAGQLPISPSYSQTLPLNRYFQYGTSMPSSGFDLSSLIAPVGGSILGAGLNFLGSAYQNYKQAQFYDKYMSPQARMEQMRAAGINPNAAAQGISGSSAPQVTASQPNGAFTGIGEQLGNSVNTALSAANIVADTKQKEVQAEGQDIQNKIAEVELGMKPDMVSAELDDLRESANQRRQAISESKEKIKEIKQNIANLKAEEIYTIAKEGQVAYENRLMEANRQLAEQERLLKKAEEELTRVNKEIQIKERDNYLTPEQRIKMPIETQYDIDPVRKDFRTEHDAIATCDAGIKECERIEVELFRKFERGELSTEEYQKAIDENDVNRRELQDAKKSAQKAFEKMSYKNGYHTWWQDNTTHVIDAVTRLASSVVVATGISTSPKGKGLTSYGPGRNNLGH